MDLTTFVIIGIIAVSVSLFFDWLTSTKFVPALREKSILITGCDSGFGRNTVLFLDKVGCQVIAGCLTSAAVEELKVRCSERVNPILMDVRDTKSIENALKEVQKLLPPGRGLWGLVNNAGVTGPLTPLEWVSKTDINEVLGVNVIGTFEVTKFFLPLLRQAGGRVINITSINARLVLGGAGAYSLSKVAMEGLTESWRRELAFQGVSVHAIQPGTFKTGLTLYQNVSRKVRDTYEGLPQDVKDTYGNGYQEKILQGLDVTFNKVASSRLDKVSDAIKTALFSVGPKNRYLVGGDARVMALISLMPDCWIDCLIRLFRMHQPQRVPQN